MREHVPISNCSGPFCVGILKETRGAKGELGIITMSKLNLPEATKIAIWNAHSRRCAYCGEPVHFTDLDIEHIVPEHLSSDLPALKKALVEYGLSPDFEVNSIQNL